MQSCVVVGGGISGLSAAWELVTRHPGLQVSVLEASDRVGGKLRGADVGGGDGRAGITVDVGAESLLARRPEGLELIRQVGLGVDLVHPATSTASIWSRGALHPMPPRTLMGIPSDVRTLRGLLSDEEVDRAGAEQVWAGADPDISIGDLVAERLGPAVLDRLVEPLLGGVYAGHAREISAAAALPLAWDAYRTGASLTATATATAAQALPRRSTDADAARPAPVFAGLRGGLHRLPLRLVELLIQRGVTVRTGATARELRREGAGFELVTGPVPCPTTYRADLVVLALPPAPAARLLTDPAPGAAQVLAQVQSASTALVTLALPADRLPDLVGSGFLVPPVEGRAIKAATFSSTKWDWVREAGRGAGPRGSDLVLLRASLGRHREETVLQRPDADLVALALREVGELVGGPLPKPVGAHVQRWGGGLPQYAVGHRQRMSTVREQVAAVPGLAVCGATYDGVGIPACIASGRAAAQVVAPGPV